MTVQFTLAKGRQEKFWIGKLVIMHLEKAPNPLQPSNRNRQRIAQALLNKEPPVTHEFRHLPYDFNSYKTMPNDELERAFDDVLYNYTHIQARGVAVTSAALVSELAAGSRIMTEYVSGRISEIPTSNGFCREPYPHPPAVNRFIHDLTGFALNVMQPVQHAHPEFQRRFAQRIALQNTLLELNTEARQRNLDVKPLPPRLRTLPSIDLSTTFTDMEIQSFLRGSSLLSDSDISKRLASHAGIQHDYRISYENNVRNIMSSIFAASHAIETQHPSISRLDTTRLLLRNADVIGSSSWPKLQDSPFLYTNDVAYGNNARNFAVLADLVHEAPMYLDADDRLHHVPSLASNGLCPLASSYILNDSLKTSFQEFNAEIEKVYDLELPVSENYVTLSTQFALLGIITGQDLLSGRSYEHIRTYREMMMGAYIAQKSE